MQYTRQSPGDSGRRIMVVAIALMVAAMLVTGFVWSQKTVNIAVDGARQTVRTVHSTPEQVLAEAGIVLGEKDEYRLTTQRVTQNTTIEVYRAVPVTVTYQGGQELVFTAKQSVTEVVRALGYEPDRVVTQPSSESRIQPGMEIQIRNLSERKVTKEVSVPQPMIRQPDPLLEKGLEQVVETGTPGKKRVTILERYADGVKLDEAIIEETTLAEPKADIVNAGTRDTIETSRGAVQIRQARMMEATAYLPTDGDGRGITATGVRARTGIVAVDPRVIPMGTEMYIPGYGWAVAADTGSAIKGNKIDLCMEDAGAAWRFGRRMIKVYILND